MASVRSLGEEKWQLRAYLGYDGNGKPIQKTRIWEEKSNSRKKAQAAADVWELQLKEGKYCAGDRKYTLNEFVEVWYRDYAEPHLAPKTKSGYMNLLNLRILPAIGHVRLEKLRPMDINRFFIDLAKSPRRDGKGVISDRYLQHHYRCLHSVLEQAVKWNVITENPCSRVSPPKVRQKQLECYNEQQTAQLLAAIQEESLKYRTIIYLAIVTGMREGELMGLEWKHIDFEKCKIRVEQASQYVKGYGVFTKDPKNESSKRPIAIPLFLVAMLKEYRTEWLENRLKAGLSWQGTDRLFCTPNGRPQQPQMPGQWFRRFIRRHNLDHTSFHGLRHLSATIAINENQPLKSVSARLGHTDIRTTANIYAVALQSADHKVAESLGKKIEQLMG